MTGKLQVPLPLLKEKAVNFDESLTESFGVVSKNDLGGRDDASWITCKLNEIESKIDLTMNLISLSEEVIELIAVPQLLQVLQNACNLVNVADVMKKVTTDSPIVNPALLPLMTPISNIILSSHQELISPTASLAMKHQKCLNNLIDSCKLQSHPVSGDGNCIFSAKCSGEYSEGPYC